MRKTRTYKADIKTGQYRREEVVIKFSKSGVDQEWRIRLNNGRLLTDEVYTEWNKPTHLRTKEHCKTLEDVLAYLGFYAYSRSSIKIIGVYDCENKGLKAILDWDYKGGSAIGRWTKKYVNKDDKLDREMIRDMKKRLEEYSYHVQHCSDCGATMPLDKTITKTESHEKEFGGHYFAGRFCKDCWERKWRAIEAKETYE